MTGDGPEPRPASSTVGDQIRARGESLRLTGSALAALDNYRKTFDILAESATTEIDPVLDKYQDLYHRLAARR